MVCEQDESCCEVFLGFVYLAKALFEEGNLRGQDPLNEKYFDTLQLSCAYDARNHIFPVAFVVVESENKNSWSWFPVLKARCDN